MAATTSMAGFLTIFQNAFRQSLKPRCLRTTIDALPSLRPCGLGRIPCKFRSARCTGAVRSLYSQSDAVSGRLLARFPVSLKSAFATAGAIGGVPGSPTPVGLSPPGTRCTSTCGISFIRSTR